MKSIVSKECPAERSERQQRDVAHVRSTGLELQAKLPPQVQRFAVRKSIPSMKSIVSKECPVERSER